MPFTLASLQPLGGQARVNVAPQMWAYKTQDSAADVDTAGYFNAVQRLLFPGDVILRVTVNASNVVQTAGWHVVMTSAAGAVNVSDTTALTVTNTD
jgi:hypothetical protein